MIARILAAFGYHRVTLDPSRLQAGTDPVERGARWETFYRERGGLADMLADIRREAFEAAAELDPSDTDKIYYWATADRNVRKLEGRIVAVIQSGMVEAEKRRALEAQRHPHIPRSI